jgi:hypothetical protein
VAVTEAKPASKKQNFMQLYHKCQHKQQNYMQNIANSLGNRKLVVFPPSDTFGWLRQVEMVHSKFNLISH